MTEKNSAQRTRTSGAKVIINEAWCKRCGICTAFCPTGVFVEDEFSMPTVKSSERCIKCMLCVIRCPDFAIKIEPLKEEKASIKKFSDAIKENIKKLNHK